MQPNSDSTRLCDPWLSAEADIARAAGLILLAVATGHCVPQPAELLQVQPTPKHLTAPLTVTCCPLPTRLVSLLGQSQGARQRSLGGGREELSFEMVASSHDVTSVQDTNHSPAGERIPQSYSPF